MPKTNAATSSSHVPVETVIRGGPNGVVSFTIWSSLTVAAIPTAILGEPTYVANAVDPQTGESWTVQAANRYEAGHWCQEELLGMMSGN